jgi:TRAP-type uncharacterized transport system fused permease subunit
VPEPGGTRQPLARRLGAAAGYVALFLVSWIVASVVMGDGVPTVAILLLVATAIVALVVRLRS